MKSKVKIVQDLIISGLEDKINEFILRDDIVKVFYIKYFNYTEEDRVFSTIAHPKYKTFHCSMIAYYDKSQLDGVDYVPIAPEADENTPISGIKVGRSLLDFNNKS